MVDIVTLLFIPFYTKEIPCVNNTQYFASEILNQDDDVDTPTSKTFQCKIYIGGRGYY